VAVCRSVPREAEEHLAHPLDPSFLPSFLQAYLQPFFGGRQHTPRRSLQAWGIFLQIRRPLEL